VDQLRLARGHTYGDARSCSRLPVGSERLFGVPVMKTNHWVQATLDGASGKFVSRWPSAPDPERSA
jgi:hypothetical protein